MSQRVHIHHHRVEEREVESTTPEQRKLLTEAGLFHATGLGYDTEVIGKKMRSGDFGRWNERDGNITLITKGGETWCGHGVGTTSAAFARACQALVIMKGDLFVHPVGRIRSTDILARQQEMREPLPSAAPENERVCEALGNHCSICHAYFADGDDICGGGGHQIGHSY